jgi:hypothetical protein
MATHEIAEAEEKLEDLIEATGRGEAVFIAHNAKPVVRRTKPAQVWGQLALSSGGLIWPSNRSIVPHPFAYFANGWDTYTRLKGRINKACTLPKTRVCSHYLRPPSEVV